MVEASKGTEGNTTVHAKHLKTDTDTQTHTDTRTHACTANAPDIALCAPLCGGERFWRHPSHRQLFVRGLVSDVQQSG